MFAHNVKCCEHNPCPQKPRWFKGRFQKRPWRCPQCSTWWVTYWTSAYDSGFWSWKRVSHHSDVVGFS